MCLSPRDHCLGFKWQSRGDLIETMKMLNDLSHAGHVCLYWRSSPAKNTGSNCSQETTMLTKESVANLIKLSTAGMPYLTILDLHLKPEVP